MIFNSPFLTFLLTIFVVFLLFIFFTEIIKKLIPLFFIILVILYFVSPQNLKNKFDNMTLYYLTKSNINFNSKNIKNQLNINHSDIIKNIKTKINKIKEITEEK